MHFLEPSFHHFQQQQQQQHHHQQQHTHRHERSASYSDAQQGLHDYAMTAQQSAMMGLPASTTKSNETKPRLGKDEVETLEREFRKNPKPTTDTKRMFAKEMGVDLARINNRRAKRKQEKKQEAFEAGQAQDVLGFSEPSSPDYYSGSAYFADTTLLPSSAYSMMSRPPPPVAPYNPQYSDPSTASMQSLHRTMAAAQAASRQHDFQVALMNPNTAFSPFGGPLVHTSTNVDRARFPSSASASSMVQFDASEGYSYTGSNVPSLYSVSNPSISESPGIISTPTSFHTYAGRSSADNVLSQALTAFPSQLLPSQCNDELPSLSNDSGESQSPEESRSSVVEIDFKYDLPESDEMSDTSPPAPSAPFKTPTPMDIASRRKKVHVKPAALTPDTLKSRPGMGPRTVSHAEGFRRLSDSPIGSPMRRIASAGGNRNVFSGRICKSGAESAQRSPINLGGFAEAGAFLEHNFKNIRQPSLTAGSSLNSSLAPPTPMSPRRGEMALAKRDYARSTASPPDGGMNFVFTGVNNCFTSMDGDQNLASPPETPQAQMSLHTVASGWPTGVDFGDKQWHYEVPDEPLYTPAHDNFQLELQTPQPSYLSSMSQPVTPAFGQFNPNVIFGHDSPQYNISNYSEYSFPESNSQYTGGMTSTSPMTKQKTFQFSNSTPADFTEK